MCGFNNGICAVSLYSVKLLMSANKQTDIENRKQLIIVGSTSWCVINDCCGLER